MSTSRDVQLVIKARDEASKAFDAAQSALESLLGATNQTGASTAAAGSKIDQMATAVLSLDKALATITGANERAAASFERQAASAARTAARLTDIKGQMEGAARAADALRVKITDAVINGIDAGPLRTQPETVTASMRAMEAESKRLERSQVSAAVSQRASADALQGLTRQLNSVGAASTFAKAEAEQHAAALQRQARVAQQTAQVLQTVERSTGVSRDRGDYDQLVAQIGAESEARDREIAKLREQEAATAALADAQLQQQRVNRLLGVDQGSGKSARDSASVFQEADIEANRRFAETTREAQRAAAALDAEVGDLRRQINPLAAIQTDLALKTARLNELQRLGKITSVEYAAALKLVHDQADLAAKRLGATHGESKPLGLAPHDLTNLSYQLNDVFTQLASGTSITQTLAQQGGQIIQIFPRVGSAVAAGLTSAPLLGFITAMGTVIALTSRAASESERLRTFQGILTANADGARYQASQLEQARKEIDRYGLSVEDSLKIVRKAIDSGLDPSRIDEFGKAAKDMADVLGTSAPDAAKKLADSLNGGFDAIEKLGRETNVFTASQLELIKRLFEQGRAQEAVTRALDILQQKFGRAAADARGPWANAVRELDSAWGDFLDTLSNSFVIQTTVQGLANLANRVTDVLNALSGTKTVQQLDEQINRQAEIYKGGIEIVRNQQGRLRYAARRGAPAAFNDRASELNALLAEREAAAARATEQATAATLRSTQETAKANERVTREQQAQAVAARQIRSEADVQAKVAEARRRALQDIQQREPNADEATRRAFADAAAAQERVSAEQQLADYRKRQADEAERSRKEREREARIITLQRPVDGRVTSGFGPRQSPGGVGSTFHRGVDFAAPIGTEVRAPAVGVVEAVGFSAELGKYVVIDHGAGLKTKVGHLSRNDIVGVGDQVTAGQRIGLSGNTGSATTGPHVHFSATKNGNPVDPFANGGRFEADAAEAAEDAEKERDRAAERLAEQQERLNEAVEQENAERRRNIAAAEQQNALTGEALLDAQKRQVGEEAVARIQDQAARQNLTLTEDQIRQTRALAEAEFEATRGLRERLSLRRQEAERPVEDLTQQRDALQAQIDFLNQNGQAGLADALLPQLDLVNQKLLDAITRLQEFWLAVQDGAFGGAAAFGMTDEGLKALIASFNVAALTTQTFQKVLGLTQRDIANTFASNGVRAVDQFAQAIAEGKNVVTSLKNAFLQFALEFLRQIAQMILQQALLNAISGALNSAFGGGAAAKVPLKHGGGIIGGGGPTRTVSPAWFTNAVRYHSGGIAGLKPDEVPAVLKRGEEVLTENDPRHRANGGAAGGTVELKNVVLFDPNMAASEIFNSPMGVQSLLTVVRENSGAFSQALNS